MKFRGNEALHRPMTGADMKALLKGAGAQSAIVFLLGLAAFGYSTLVVLKGDIAESARVAAIALSQDARMLSQRSKALAAAAKAAEDAPPLTSVPAFIDRIGALAGRHNTAVMSIQPLRDSVDTFDITLASGYRALIGFVAALEELDVQVVGFGINRQALKANAPTLTATVKIRPRNDARRLAIPRIQLVREALFAEQARDPFQALITGGGDGAERVDITDAYKLTGVATLEPSGERIATIDLIDYVVGDVLDGRLVVDVTEDRVLLDSLDERRSDKYVIRFVRDPANIRQN